MSLSEIDASSAGGGGGGGGTPAGVDSQVQFNAAGVFGASALLTWDGTILTAPVYSALRPGIGAVSTDGLVLTNTAAAVAGAQQWSPRLHFIGQGWKTDATAASQAVDWIIEIQPVQSTANPANYLTFSAQVNAGGYTTQVTFKNTGTTTTIRANAFDSATNILWGNNAGGGDANYVYTPGLALTSGTTAFATDTVLIRDAAGVSAQRSGTNAQKARLYNTFTTINTAGEWFKQDWQTTANQFRFGAAKGSSTGTARQASWDYGGTEASPVAAITVPITSGAIIFGGGIQLAGAVTQVNGIATAGSYGVPAIVAAARVIGQTGAVASVASYVNAAVDGSFWVSMNLLMTAFTAGTVSGVVTYTDEGNTARSLTMTLSSIGGVLGTTAGAAGAFEGVPLHIRVKASTTITITTTVTAFTGTYNVDGCLVQLA